MNYKVIKSLSDIEDIRYFWTQWHTFPNVDIDFYHHVIDSRKESVIPYVIIYGLESNPNAIVVARLENGFVNIKLGYKTVFRLKLKTIIVMHNGLLGTLNQLVYQSILTSLKSALRNNVASMVRFELVNDSSVLADSIKTHINPFFLEQYIVPQTHWLMKIPNHIDKVFSSLSKSHRNKLRKIIKQLETDFPSDSIKIRCFMSPDELETMFIDVESIAKKTYQRGLGTGFIDNNENRERLLLEATNNWLKMYVLYINNNPCAYWWGLTYKNIFYSCAMGYVPEMQNYSIGTYIFIKVLTELCRNSDNVQELDFGPGDALYKQQFGDTCYKEYSISIFAPTLSGLLLNILISGNNGINLFAKYLLNRFKLMETIKKIWRKNLRDANPY